VKVLPKYKIVNKKGLWCIRHRVCLFFYRYHRAVSFFTAGEIWTAGDRIFAEIEIENMTTNKNYRLTIDK